MVDNVARIRLELKLLKWKAYAEKCTAENIQGQLWDIRAMRPDLDSLSVIAR